MAVSVTVYRQDVFLCFVVLLSRILSVVDYLYLYAVCIAGFIEYCK